MMTRVKEECFWLTDGAQGMLCQRLESVMKLRLSVLDRMERVLCAKQLVEHRKLGSAERAVQPIYRARLTVGLAVGAWNTHAYQDDDEYTANSSRPIMVPPSLRIRLLSAHGRMGGPEEALGLPRATRVWCASFRHTWNTSR